jgi:hypothetical protein
MRRLMAKAQGSSIAYQPYVSRCLLRNQSHCRNCVRKPQDNAQLGWRSGLTQVTQLINGYRMRALLSLVTCLREGRVAVPELIGSSLPMYVKSIKSGPETQKR